MRLRSSALLLPFGRQSVRNADGSLPHHWLEEGQMLLIGGSCRLSQKKSHEKPWRAANRSNLYSR